MEAQRVMRRRMLVLVDIVDSRWMTLCRETIIRSSTAVLLMGCCCCLSAGVWALALSYTSLLLSLILCHVKSSTHGCLPWRPSVWPQGVQTCDTFQEYLMLCSLSLAPLSPTEWHLCLQFSFEWGIVSFLKLYMRCEGWKRNMEEEVWSVRSEEGLLPNMLE